MKRITALLTALLLASLSLTACGVKKESKSPASTAATADEASSSANEKTKAQAKTVFEESFRTRNFQGAAYMVRKGEEIYAGGADKADKKTGIDNSPDVVYQIASVTKQFTAAAILKMCEAKKLDLNDKVSKYYPDYAAGSEMTIHHLLTMQSGIPDFSREYDENGNERDNASAIAIDGMDADNSAQENRAALKKWILSQKLLFTPGERYSYSNSGYFLLGEILEQVSGTDYFTYLKTNFFEPLHMTTAGFVEDYAVEGAAVAHGYNHSGASFDYNGVSFASADIMASPKDMYQWSVSLHGGKVLSNEMYQKMITKHVRITGEQADYGYGLMIADSAGGAIYFHQGNRPGFNTVVLYAPQSEKYLALMSNYASESIMAVAKDVSLKLF